MTIQYQGTLCGVYIPDITSSILCNGINISHSCPMNYTKLVVYGSVFCYRTNTSEEGDGLAGTLCGIDTRITCGGMSPKTGCPTGYLSSNDLCYKYDPNVNDLQGTLCGYIADGSGPTCNGLPVGQCPEGYKAFHDEQAGFFICYKDS